MQQRDQLPETYASERADGRREPRPLVQTGRRKPALQDRGPQRESLPHGLRPPVRTSHVPGHEGGSRLRYTGTDGLRGEQRLHQQRLHGLLHHPAQGQHRNGPLARKRPHDGTRHLAGKPRNRETGCHRGV